MREYGDASGAACSSPMVALAGVGSYGTVLNTKIARNSRRACNLMISNGSSAPAVFWIPIGRSIFGCRWPVPRNAGQVSRRAARSLTLAGIGCGFTRSLVRMPGSNRCCRMQPVAFARWQTRTSFRAFGFRLYRDGEQHVPQSLRSSASPPDA